MNVSEAKEVLKRDLEIQIENKALPDGIMAMEIAIKSLEMQDKLKQWIENYKNPEFKDVTITRDGLIDILEEFRLECAE